MVIDGPFLKKERERDGWTVSKFADEIGVSPQYLRDIEAGRRQLKRRPDLIKQIADKLDLPFSKLVRESTESVA